MNRRQFMGAVAGGVLATGILRHKGMDEMFQQNATDRPGAGPLVGVSVNTQGPSAGAVDPELMKAAGVELVRHHFPLPFSDRIGGQLKAGYRKARSQAEVWRAAGIEIMGVTPVLGWGGPGAWQSPYPEWFGALGTEQFLASYQSMCEWMAEDLRGLVKMWQIANEVDNPFFAGPLNERQACAFLLRAARGLRSGGESLVIGSNSTGRIPGAFYLFGYLFGRPYPKGSPCPLDYCGTDEYFGSYTPGSPEDWEEWIAKVHTLTEMPVMVNEWGFPSAGGGTMTDLERYQTGAWPCALQKWPFTWGAGHTPEGQAEYVRVCFESFWRQRDKLVAVVYYCWEDEQRCHYCGSPDCHTTSANGLVDVHGRPKPAYYAFQEGAARLRRERQAGGIGGARG